MPAPDAIAVDLHAQRDALVHRHRERLGAAHAAEAGGERDRAGERAAEAPARDLREALVGALHDPLAADVDPRARRHLAVHRQPERLEPAELVPGGPLADQVGVRDQHARRPLVRAEHAHRLPRLDEHGLVVGERPQRAHQRVERLPRARGLARCRRTRRARPAAPPRPGRGCSSASAARPPAPQPRQDSSAPRGAWTVAGAHSRLPIARLDRVEHRARRHQRLGLRQLRRQPAVRPRAGHRRAHRGERGGGAGAGLERRAQVERPRGAGELHGEDAAAGSRPRCAACAPRPSPSTRGPPASRSSGSESVLAGTASRRFSATIAAWV